MTNMVLSGRYKEALIVRNANVSCAVGRLMLGELTSWLEFLKPDQIDYENLPRRQLKSGKYDIQNNLQRRIDGFCKSNFTNMTQAKLVLLYEEVKAKRGLEIPYLEFSNKYSPVRNFQELGYPNHSTVCLSLWGLQYRFPEHDFANDLCMALEHIGPAKTELDKYQEVDHNLLLKEKDTIASAVRRVDSAKRQLMQSSFSLLECYLNGLAWHFYQEANVSELSERQTKLIKDTTNATLREKLSKYPKIIFGTELNGKSSQFILDVAKLYRDSLMHPSPFSAPERFGGYDKLEKLYSLTDEVVSSTVFGVIEIVEELTSMKAGGLPLPVWLSGLRLAANNALQGACQRAGRPG